MNTKSILRSLGQKKRLAAAIPLFMAAQAQGYEFFMGEIEGSLDSQISMGSSWRTEKQDANLTLGIDAAGNTNAANNNDGDLNYEKGDAFSQVFKGSHDLQLSYQNYGAFVRGKYWYDAALEGDSSLDDSNNNDLAKYSGAEILDAFVYGEFEVLDMPLDLRLGKQVVSWGESTFILGGINQVNPVDVSAFRRPGAEIKEGLIPVNMAFASLGLTENLSAEAFYQLDFHKTVISSCGTYFATNDYAPEGCGPVETAVGQVDRSADVSPDSDGQFGVAFRYFSEALDTEFGFYAMNIHSRVPLVSGVNSQVNEVGILLAAATDPTSAEAQTAAAVGGSGNLVAIVSAEGALNVGFGEVGSDAVPMTYFIEYPEDQKLAAVSFATNVASIALSGEITHKLDVPFQVNSTMLLNAGLAAQATAAGDLLLGTDDLSSMDLFAQEAVSTGEGEVLAGYKIFDVTQVQVTGIKTIDQVFGASGIVIIAEAGYTFAHDFDDSADNAIKFDGNGDMEDTVTESSWGYRARIVGQYNDAFAGVNLSPVLSWSHDVDGVSPAPGGNFIEDQKVLGFALNAEYQNMYTGSISYTQYSGGDTNSLGDRDNASISVGIQF